MTVAPLIEIEGLRVIFHGDDGRTTHAVDSVDLSVANGATVQVRGLLFWNGTSWQMIARRIR